MWSPVPFFLARMAGDYSTIVLLGCTPQLQTTGGFQNTLGHSEATVVLDCERMNPYFNPYLLPKIQPRGWCWCCPGCGEGFWCAPPFPRWGSAGQRDDSAWPAGCGCWCACARCGPATVWACRRSDLGSCWCGPQLQSLRGMPRSRLDAESEVKGAEEREGHLQWCLGASPHPGVEEGAWDWLSDVATPCSPLPRLRQLNPGWKKGLVGPNPAHSRCTGRWVRIADAGLVAPH